MTEIATEMNVAPGAVPKSSIQKVAIIIITTTTNIIINIIIITIDTK